MELSHVQRKLQWAEWQLRYWVLDKYHERLRGSAFMLSVATTAGLSAYVIFRISVSPEMQDGQPVRAVINIWVYLAWMVVSALLSYTLRPKIKPPEPKDAESPTADEGGAAVRVYGDEWLPGVWLGWRKLGRDPIRKGGKK